MRRSAAVAGRSSPAQRDLTRAWWSLAAYPVAFVVAFVAGQAVPSVLGYDVATEEPPWWVAVTALTCALVVLVIPLALTLRLGRRAVAGGEPAAKAPMAIGAVVVGGFAAVNVVSGVLMALLE